VRLPAEKLQGQITQIVEFAAPGNQLLFHQVEVMAGRLKHILYMLLQL
jgi:hypothetical protein